MQLINHDPKDREFAIEVDGLSFGYGEELALHNIGFQIKNGDYVGVIGPNGGGKTTLLKLLIGLLTPLQGNIKIFGQDTTSRSRERVHIGYVPQYLNQFDLNFPATVYEVVMSGRTPRLGIFKTPQEADRTAVDRAIEITDLGELAQVQIGRLSGGQRQRVFIARALASEPNVLLLDEPTVGVDIPSQEKFFAFLAKLNHEYGLTIVLVSHDIDVVSQEVHTLLCINREVVCYGPAKDLLTKDYLEKLYGKNIAFAFHGH